MSKPTVQITDAHIERQVAGLKGLLNKSAGSYCLVMSAGKTSKPVVHMADKPLELYCTRIVPMPACMAVGSSVVLKAYQYHWPDQKFRCITASNIYSKFIIVVRTN